MDELIIENIRCFAGKRKAPIKPLTLLVGENSTGKTTFLASVRAAVSLQAGRLPDFNEEPFRLGSYEQIANYRGGRAGRAQSFAIGQRFQSFSPEHHLRSRRLRSKTSKEVSSYHVEARFVSHNAQPSIEEWFISSAEYTLRLNNLKSGDLAFQAIAGDDIIYSDRISESFPFPERDIPFILYVVSQRFVQEDGAFANKTNEHLFNLAHSLVPISLPYSFAPIRARPQRTYEPAKEIRNTEGDHIPLMLERLFSADKKTKRWERLEDFGSNSGLYNSLSIRRPGRKRSDPFQIQVKHPQGGPFRNLVDVGYGVSQVIPIIADSVLTNSGSTLLIQQPEVHLHPRAQAELGSFFANLVAQRNRSIIVETHSDHLIDRVRMDVRDKKIKSDDVIILYFEQDKPGVNIHPIWIDGRGNIQGQPSEYRRFFLEEERRYFEIS